MPPTALRHLSLGAIALLSASTVSMAPALAQETRTLTENPGLIRGCRQLNRTTEVFDNSTLGPASNRIGSLPAGTQVTLTGAVSPGRAQVFLSSGSLSAVQPVGWLNAANLAPCGTAPPAARACFRANFSLVVRPTPGSTTPLAGYNPGDTIFASSNPPTESITADGRRWMAVTIYNGSTGWIARTGPNGVGSNVTAIPCP
ncbi:hypothetical protein PGN35_027850 [Nodosilinea sp. PGN35]|uniref:hypothetical protein n=1 Tax=Nodosilinea sp. PGN35 TaxID=3020489 RepID=UPI0023B2B22E|nr:hypothetical protein [Nodosilinea sp. TSF1-S3]MDF0365252.1 hypothetical protein [Nodosilinea sp. TSF1-S3]